MMETTGLSAARTGVIAAALLAITAAASAAPTSRSRQTHAALPNAEIQKKDDVNAGIVGLAGGQLEGAPIRLAAEIARVVDDGAALHVLPIVTRGPTENVDSLLYLRGVDLAIINSDVLEPFTRQVPNLRNRISYVLNLFPSEVHVLVGPGISRLEDLAGKKVNFNTAGTAAAYSGPLIFDRLGIGVERTFIPHQIAIEQMKSGETAAVFFITSKPVDVFLKKRFEPGYKFLPLPYDERLSDYYMPATLSHADYPALIQEEEDVPTVAVPTALVAFNWPSSTDRHRRLTRFIDRLFDRLPALQAEGFDPKWRSVNLAGEVPSLMRLKQAQDWLDRANAQVQAGVDIERARKQIARQSPLPPTEQERLLQEFLQWTRDHR